MFSNLRPDRWCHLFFPASWVKFRNAVYVEVLSIEGLPELTDKEEFAPANVTIKALKQASATKYSSYFFHEGMRLMCLINGPTQPLKVTYREEGVRTEVADYAAACAAQPPRYLKLGLFPYTLPLDTAARHCD
jgi:hypothetical protein